MQHSVFSKSPSLVMAMQAKLSKGVDKELLIGLENSRKTFGQNSQAVKDYEALLRSQSSLFQTRQTAEREKKSRAI